MKKRTTRIYTILVFILVFILCTVIFYHSNSISRDSMLMGYRNSVFLITQKEAELIQEKYFNSDDLFHFFTNNDDPHTNEIFNEITQIYPFFSSIELILDKPFFSDHNFLITSDMNRLTFNFSIANDSRTKVIADKYYRIEFDVEKLFHELRILDHYRLSASPSATLFVYGIKIELIDPPLSILQIIIGIIHGMIFSVIYYKISNRFFSYFYNSEGLEKIIYLFEKTEEYSANHSRNVAEISSYLGKELGLKRRKLKDLKVAAYLHDIGKISVPVEILNKNGALNKDEFGEVKKHVVYSAEIIENFESLKHLKDIILYHHEKTDGSGYPIGLYGNQIPLESRIIAVADIFEALVGERPYRSPIQRDDAINIMKGMPIDQEILKILTEKIEEINSLITYRKDRLRKRALIV